MNVQLIREALENRQIFIYFGAVAAAVAAAYAVPGTTALEIVVNPALALMLYLTFLQVPMPELNNRGIRPESHPRVWRRWRRSR